MIVGRAVYDWWCTTATSKTRISLTNNGSSKTKKESKINPTIRSTLPIFYVRVLSVGAKSTFFAFIVIISHRRAAATATGGETKKPDDYEVLVRSNVGDIILHLHTRDTRSLQRLAQRTYSLLPSHDTSPTQESSHDNTRFRLTNNTSGASVGVAPMSLAQTCSARDSTAPGVEFCHRARHSHTRYTVKIWTPASPGRNIKMMQIRKVMDHEDAKTTVSSHGHATKTLTDVSRTKTSFDLGGTRSKSMDDGRSRKVIHTKENRHTLNKKFESLCKKTKPCH